MGCGTRSCGCLYRESARALGYSRTKHGGAVGLTRGEKRDPRYFVWVAMIQRCTNPNNKRFADYGGRGIRVCDRWRESFEHFIEDMGPRPAGPGTISIERKDNDGSYEPSNCVWATAREQKLNQRTRDRVASDRAAFAAGARV